MRIASWGLALLGFAGCQQKDQRQAPEPTARAFEARSSEPKAVIDAALSAPRLLAFRFDQGWGPCDPKKGPCRTLLRITADCQMDEEHDNHPSHAMLDAVRRAPLLDLARDQIAPILRAPDTCGKTFDIWEKVALEYEGDGGATLTRNVVGWTGEPWLTLRAKVKDLRQSR